MQRGGFTLIELLVSISIIALLVSILLPTLAQTRRATQAVQCMSLQRQIGIAFANYLTMERERFPVLNIAQLPGLSATPETRRHWYNQLGAVDALPATESTGNFFRWSPALFCPTHLLRDASSTGWSDRYWAAANGLISYGMSDTLFRNFELATTPIEPATFSEIDQPASTVLTADSIIVSEPASSTGGRRGGYFRLFAWHGGASGVAMPRHDRSAAVLWIDGHVTRVKTAGADDTIEAQFQGMYDVSALGFRSVGNSRFAPYYWDRRKRP